MIRAAVEQLDDRVDRDSVRRHDHGRLDDPRDCVLRGEPAGDDARADDRVREDEEVVAVPDEDRRGVVVRHRLRRPADRHARLGEHRRPADQLLDANRPELRQRVDEVARLDEPFPQRHRDPPRALRPPEHDERLLPRDHVADRVLVGPHREGRGEPRQERRMAEALARLEDVDGLALMDELHRARPDHERLLHLRYRRERHDPGHLGPRHRPRRVGQRHDCARQRR